MAIGHSVPYVEWEYIIGSTDKGQNIVVVYLYKYKPTLTFVPYLYFFYYITTPHKGQNTFRRLTHPFPSHFPGHRAWEESFPAHTRWRQRRPPWTPQTQRTEDPARQAERGTHEAGRGRERTGQRRLGGRGWRPGCCSPTSPSLSRRQPAAPPASPAVQGHGHERPSDPAHPRQHRRGPSVPQCHLLSDFCLFL